MSYGYTFEFCNALGILTQNTSYEKERLFDPWLDSLLYRLCTLFLWHIRCLIMLFQVWYFFTLYLHFVLHFIAILVYWFRFISVKNTYVYVAMLDLHCSSCTEICKKNHKLCPCKMNGVKICLTQFGKKWLVQFLRWRLCMLISYIL